MAQFARPISDVSNFFWTPSTGADLYAMLDESSADDADYITSTASQGAVTVMDMTSLTDPGVHTGHILRVRHLITVGQQVNVRILSSDDVVLIVNIDGTGSIATHEHTLSTDDAALITDYTTLQIKLDANNLANSTNLYWAELEIPDAGSGAGLHRLINGNLVNFGLLNNGLIT